MSIYTIFSAKKAKKFEFEVNVLSFFKVNSKKYLLTAID